MAKAPKLEIVGRVYTPFKRVEDLPIQGTASDGRGTVAIQGEYEAGLKDLDGFDRVWLLYLVESEGLAMRVTPRLDAQHERGVFATRQPAYRPNPIGLTTVKLLRIEGPTLHVEGVDLLDDSPLLDIKPYVPRLDAHENAWAGWLEQRFPAVKAWRKRQ